MALVALIILLVLLLILGVIIFLDVRSAKKNHTQYHVKETLLAFALMLPALVLAFLFVIIPILYSLGYSFTDYYTFASEGTPINFTFENFGKLIEEINRGDDLAYAIRNTAIFVVLVVPLQIGVALLLALFCNIQKKGSVIFKICFFAPVVVSLTVSSMLWTYIYDPSEFGVLNSIFIKLGIPKQDFLQDEKLAMIWIVIMSAWQGAGYQMLIFLSALSNTRKDLYEAASLDGCSRWTKFRIVTLPALKPTFIYILVTVFIGACRVMIQPMIMTGYKHETVTISYYMYQVGKVSGLVGKSSTVALIMTIIIGAITFFQRKVLGKEK